MTRIITKFKMSLMCISMVIFFSCKENSKEYSSDLNSSHSEIAMSDAAIKVTMEGKTHQIQQKELNPVNITFENDTLQFVFYTNDNPFKLNFNLNNTGILEKGTATFKIPETNSEHTKADLNFFNRNRDVKSMNKRIIFRKGMITVQKLTEHKLEMTFEGEGSGITEYTKTFPITGAINVSY